MLSRRTRSLRAQSAWLLGGRLAGFAVAFVVPIVIVRLLPQADYGTYKQFLLICGFLIGILPMGAGASLYYFIPREPARARGYLLQTVMFLLLVGGVAAAGLWTFRDELARRFDSPDLVLLAGLMGLFVIFELLGHLLEQVIVVAQQARAGAAVFAGSDLVRAIALLVPALLTRSLFWVCAGAVVYAFLRATALVAWSLITYGVRRPLRLDWGQAEVQARYALPFGVSVLVHNVLLLFHSFYVASVTGPAVFAVYAVGTQQIAPVQLFFKSLFDVTLVRMTEHHAGEQWADMQRLWRTLIAKQGLIMVPVVVGMWMLAPAFIEGVFTAAYLDAVPVFRLQLLVIWLTMLNDHSVLRACGDTKVILGASVAGLVATVVAVPLLMPRLGLSGAILGFLIGLVCVKLVGLSRLRRVLHMRRRDVLPWGVLGRYLTASVLAATLVYPTLSLVRGPVLQFLVSGFLFWVVYGALGWLGRLFTGNDRQDILALVHLLARRLRRSDL